MTVGTAFLAIIVVVYGFGGLRYVHFVLRLGAIGELGVESPIGD